MKIIYLAIVLMAVGCGFGLYFQNDWSKLGVPFIIVGFVLYIYGLIKKKEVNGER